MYGYHRAIVEATGCDPADAEAIEEVMRIDRPTLDSLTRRDFDRLAQAAHEALPQIRAEGLWPR